MQTRTTDSNYHEKKIKLPAGLAPGSDYSIKIVSTRNPALQDQSVTFPITRTTLVNSGGQNETIF